MHSYYCIVLLFISKLRVLYSNMFTIPEVRCGALFVSQKAGNEMWKAYWILVLWGASESSSTFYFFEKNLIGGGLFWAFQIYGWIVLMVFWALIACLSLCATKTQFMRKQVILSVIKKCAEGLFMNDIQYHEWFY